MKILITAFLVINCLGFQQTNAYNIPADYKYYSLKPDREADENNIREAVFRYQFKHNASGQQQDTQIYFLSFAFGSHKDPSDEFMKRFKGNKPKVKKVSQSVSGIDGVKDRQTGKAGLIFNVTGIEWKNENEVEVSGGYFEAGLSASGNTYLVVRKNNKWTVEKDTMEWIS